MSKQVEVQKLSTEETAIEDCMNRVANALSVGAETFEIREMLKDSGNTDYQAYLNFIAGRMLLESRNTGG